MPLFEVDPERPVLVQPDQERVTLSTTAQRVVDGQIDALLGERIFPIAEGRSSAEPHLLAIDATGSPVVIEVVANLDDAALQRALKHAGAAGRLTRAELAARYAGGADSFAADLDGFFDGLPYGSAAGPHGATPPGGGARLVVICSAAREDILDAVDFLRQPGARASVLRVAVVHAEDGRRFVDVSPLAIERAATSDPGLVTIDSGSARKEIPIRTHSQAPVVTPAPAASRAPWAPAVTVSAPVPAVPAPAPAVPAPVSAPVRMTRAAARAAERAKDAADVGPVPTPVAAPEVVAPAPTVRSRRSREDRFSSPTPTAAESGVPPVEVTEVPAPGAAAPPSVAPSRRSVRASTAAAEAERPWERPAPAADPLPPTGSLHTPDSYRSPAREDAGYEAPRYDTPPRDAYDRDAYAQDSYAQRPYGYGRTALDGGSYGDGYQNDGYQPDAYQHDAYREASYGDALERGTGYGSYSEGAYAGDLDPYTPPVYDAPPAVPDRYAQAASAPVAAPDAGGFPAPDFDEDDPDLAMLARSIGIPTALVWTRPRRGERFEATLLTDGSIELSDGTRYRSPDSAAAAASGTYTADGWSVWRFGENGPSLTDEFRHRFA